MTIPPSSRRHRRGSGADPPRRGSLGRPVPRRGLTLIEVVAALALMATLLAAVLTIRSGLARRQAAADRQLRAVAAADGLLSTWWHDPATFPVGRAGGVGSVPPLTWSTRAVADGSVGRVGGRIVRLDIHDGPATPVSVDVVLPLTREGP